MGTFHGVESWISGTCSYGYKRVDLEAVWHTIEHDLPGVAELLEELFRVLGPWRPGES
jgi:uncharacterized protein with HEPN domain